jgi:hypothetical protein
MSGKHCRRFTELVTFLIQENMFHHIILVLVTLIEFGEGQDLRVWALDVSGL